MKKKKTKKPKYNQTSSIMSSLKRTFSRSPLIQEILKDHRQEHAQYNKDGSLAKKPAVRYPCAECDKIHMGSNIQVDHLDPVVPLNIPAKHACMNEIIKRLFCEKDNLQILCKDCHKIKSKEENKIRNEWKSETKEKHIVYITTNRVSGKIYIGIHSTFDYDDGYLGSGTLLKAAILKYGKDKFYRKILFVYDTREEALNKEKELVDSNFIDRTDTYNLMLGGVSNKTNLSTGFNTWNKGIPQTDEVKLKLSVANTGKSVGSKNGNFGGKAFTPEIKAKIGDRYYPIGKDHTSSISVYCVELDKYFDSKTEAEKELNNSKSISKALDNGIPINGYHFLRAKDVTEVNINKIKDKKVKSNGGITVQCVETGQIFKSVSSMIKWCGKTDQSNPVLIKIKKDNFYAGYHWKLLKDSVE